MFEAHKGLGQRTCPPPTACRTWWCPRFWIVLAMTIQTRDLVNVIQCHQLHNPEVGNPKPGMNIFHESSYWTVWLTRIGITDQWHWGVIPENTETQCLLLCRPCRGNHLNIARDTASNQSMKPFLKPIPNRKIHSKFMWFNNYKQCKLIFWSWFQTGETQGSASREAAKEHGWPQLKATKVWRSTLKVCWVFRRARESWPISLLFPYQGLFPGFVSSSKTPCVTGHRQYSHLFAGKMRTNSKAEIVQRKSSAISPQPKDL